MTIVFHMPTKIVFGVDAIKEIGKEAKLLGGKAIVVTYPDIRKIGLLDKVIANLEDSGVDTVVFDKVEPNPRSSTCDEGVKLARNEKIDLVIGLGGGSAMDAAKAVAMTTNTTSLTWDVVTKQLQPTGPVPPIIQVPTLAGTGAEISYDAVITNWNTHEKMPLYEPGGPSEATVAIVDPAITLTVPVHQTKAGGVDIFCHVVEIYITDADPTPLTDSIREAVMKIAVQYLPQVLAKPDNIEARTQLSWASTLAMSENLMRLGGGEGGMPLHGIEHALSGYYDVTHGDGLAALLPAWMKSTLPTTKARVKQLGKNVFGKTDGLRATEEWLEQVGMRLRLSDLGCKLEHADEIAELTLICSPWANLDAETVASIYRDAF